MKKFEYPRIEVEAFSVEDIITVSGGVDCNNNDTMTDDEF